MERSLNFHLPLIQRVDLRTPNRSRLASFYHQFLGFHEIPSGTDESLVATDEGNAVMRLVEDRGATPPPRRSTGLYHVAFLFPSRRWLAAVARKLVRMGWPIQGFVDHGVSQAIYLNDPDGNGVELAVDTEFSDWPFVAGRPSIQTKGLGLEELVGESERLKGDDQADRSDVIIGHVHLVGSRLESARAYFAGDLGLDVTQDGYPGALFFAKGDYHHHFAVNVWLGLDLPRPSGRVSGLIGCQLAEPLAGTSYLEEPHRNI